MKIFHKNSRKNEDETVPEEAPDSGHFYEKVEERLIGIYGAIDPENCGGLVGTLLSLRDSGRNEVLADASNPKSKTVVFYEPIKFLISSEGGFLNEMFSVYDVMRDVRSDCEIHTYGLGKIMSAAVLLMAAGTKKKRKVGKNCRFMLHSVSNGNFGAFHDLENQMEETKKMQDRYVAALCSESKMSEKKLRSIFSKKIDYFFDAQEAVKLGIADIIV